MTDNRLDVSFALRLTALALGIVLLAGSALAQTPEGGIPTWLRGSWEGIPEWQEPVRTLEIDGQTEVTREAEVVGKARYGRAAGELRTVQITVKRGSDPRVPFGYWYGGRPAIVLEGTSQDWLDGLVLTGVGPRRLEGYYFGVPPGGKTFVRFWKIGAKDATLDPKTTGLLGSWEGKWSRCTSERLKRTSNEKQGFVLDPNAAILWAPIYIDEVVFSDEGLTVLEDKAMSSFQFRRATMGILDYGKQCQLAGKWLALLKEAHPEGQCHLATLDGTWKHLYTD